MRAVWEGVAERYLAYRLALPGDATFVCQAELCDAYCCRSYSVGLGDAEVARMQRISGLQPVEFLESEEGEPIRLPLAQPFLLRRRENRCAQLRADLSCEQYEGRPNACRLYPHFVLVFDPKSERPVHADEDAIRAAVTASMTGAEAACVALLLRHIECPGFTGPPMTDAAWQRLFEETYRLQYSAD
jgi:Fe-S-cluster containining protein